MERLHRRNEFLIASQHPLRPTLIAQNGDTAEQRAATLRRALAEDGPQVFHCTAGKDRTGWVASLLQHVAGVDDATIESDYLLTNERSAQSRARTEEQITAHLGASALEVFEPTLVADLEYLHAAYAAAEQRYGDRAAYLREGLGLDEATLERLRTRLLG